MLQYAFICIHHASICTRRQPYASIRVIYAPGHQYSTHILTEKSKSQTHAKNRYNRIAIRSAKSVRIQTKSHNSINICKDKNLRFLYIGLYRICDSALGNALIPSLALPIQARQLASDQDGVSFGPRPQDSAALQASKNSRY